MKKAKIITMVILGLIFCSNNLQAEKSNYELAKNIEISFREINGGNYYSTIIFKNSDNKEINTFNIVENNPFLISGYPTIDDNHYGFPVFDLRGYDINKIIQDRSIYQIQDDNIELEFATTLANVSSAPIRFNGDLNYIIVSYNLFISGKGYGKVGLKSVALIIDRNGKIIEKREFPNFICHHPTITQDGRYFAFSYGKSYVDPLILDLYTRIYDLENDTIIKQSKIENEYSQASPFIEDGQLIFSYDANGYNMYEIYDFENNKVYSKKYYKLGFLKARTKKGFIFGVNSRKDENTYIDTYEDSFEKKEF